MIKNGSSYISFFQTMRETDKVRALQNKNVTLLVTGIANNLDKAVRNLKNVYLVDAKKVSTYDLIDCEVLVIEKASVSILTEILSD